MALCQSVECTDPRFCNSSEVPLKLEIERILFSGATEGMDGMDGNASLDEVQEMITKKLLLFFPLRNIRLAIQD